jgi:hypothetical protein
MFCTTVLQPKWKDGYANRRMHCKSNTFITRAGNAYKWPNERRTQSQDMRALAALLLRNRHRIARDRWSELGNSIATAEHTCALPDTGKNKLCPIMQMASRARVCDAKLRVVHCQIHAREASQ